MNRVRLRHAHCILRSTGVRSRRLDRSRTVQESLSLLFPDGWQVNCGKQSEAERLEQKLAEEKREKELDVECSRNRELHRQRRILA